MTHISEYLEKVGAKHRYQLKQYEADKFEGAKSAFIQCCKSIVPNWRDLNSELTDNLVHYCMQSSEFKGDTSKGLLFMGSTGTGKTVYLKALALMMGYSNQFKFKIYTGWEMEKVYLGEPTSQDTFSLETGLNAKMFGIDDIGEEHATVKRYGTEINVGVEALTHRHLRYTDKGYLTFATTNLNAEMFSRKYGGRIESRIHEMFNLVIVNGNDLRK